jgi:ubiquinone/menaquinone biosynthesis C-methylase UbiE
VKLNRLEFFLMNNRGRAWSQRALETPLMIGAPGALRGLRVLEVGCGRGVGMEILLELLEAAEVVGFDIDPEMVALAKERTARFGHRARVFVGDAERIEAPDASFDAVVDYGILHHVPDWRRALSEIARVLKPSGVFYFEDILKGFTGAPLMLTLFDHPQVTQFSGPEFRGALAAAGLQLEDSWRKLGGVGLLGRARRIDQAGAPATERGASALPMPVHTWFGVNAVVQRAGGQDCDILVEGKAIPHPSLVNRFLRYDLPEAERLRLGAWHEAGHLQTLPFVALYGLALIARLVRYGRARQTWRRWPGLLLTLAGTVGAWELASESYVVAQTGVQAYTEAYGEDGRRPALFGVIAAGLGLGALAFRL